MTEQREKSNEHKMETLRVVNISRMATQLFALFSLLFDLYV